MKQCTRCLKTKELSAFSPRRTRPCGIYAECKVCYQERYAEYRKKNYEKSLSSSKICNKVNKHKKNALNRKRFAAKLQRTPKWLTELHFQQIEIFYKSASDLTKELGVPMEVDHIVPLQGENVSGLHVPWNLQVISESENCKKNNKY